MYFNLFMNPLHKKTITHWLNNGKKKNTKKCRPITFQKKKLFVLESILQDMFELTECSSSNSIIHIWSKILTLLDITWLIFFKICGLNKANRHGEFSSK